MAESASVEGSSHLTHLTERHGVNVLFTAFVLGGTLSIIIFMFERAVSKKKDSALKKIDGKHGNTVKRRIPKTNEIGVQCNIGQSVAIGTKNIIIY